jgi:hypothetical protein
MFWNALLWSLGCNRENLLPIDLLNKSLSATLKIHRSKSLDLEVLIGRYLTFILALGFNIRTLI